MSNQITIYDVAEKADVSAMTVSRVINNSGRISDKTRTRVKRVMEELGYVPNTVARSLVLQETKLLSLLITDITNPFYTTLARGAEDAAMKAGYKLLFSNSDEDLVKEKAYLDMVLSTRVDGVLFAPAGDNSAEHLAKLRRHRVPFVLIDREVPGIDCDRVLGDSKEGARQLVDQLIGLGHRRIALLNGSLNVSTARHRQTGYLEAMKLADLAVRPEWIVELGYAHSADKKTAAAVFSLLERPERPTALFAANNFIAVAAIRALREQGLRVPEDLSVACFDDLEAASALDPFLTVASQPAYEFGYRGISLLIERIGRPAAEADWRTLILPSELIVRKSTATVGKG